MVTSVEELLPPAQAFMEKVLVAESEKEAKHARMLAAAEAEKKAFIDKMSKPSGVSDEEAIKRAVRIIERAVSNGFTKVQVYRFPHTLCTDNGRAINQSEQGWEATLTGVPKEIYQLWHKYFRPKGYRLHAEIIDYPGGMPGDVGLQLQWD